MTLRSQLILETILLITLPTFTHGVGEQVCVSVYALYVYFLYFGYILKLTPLNFRACLVLMRW